MIRIFIPCLRVAHFTPRIIVSMKTSFPVILVLAASFFSSIARSAPKKEATNPETLVTKARSQQLWDERTPPLRIKAELGVAGANGATAQGDYIFDWVSPTEWREEIKFANYERLRVRDARGYWQKSTLDYQPMLVYELSGMLQVKDVLKVRSAQTLGKVKSREKDGARQSCVAVNWARANDRVLCFDESNGALVGIEYPQNDRPAPPPIFRIEFGAFHSVGAKLVPFEIRAVNDGKTVATVKVLEITEVKEINTALFNPPSDAVLWLQCDGMQDAEPVERVPLNYSPAIPTFGATRVILYAVIEENGSLSHVTVIQGANPDMNTAAVEAFRRWRYKPAQCGQTPIRVETSMYFDFRR
jgi:TonB family protein